MYYERKVYTENQVIDKGFVHIKDGKIADVGEGHFQEVASSRFNSTY